MPTNLVNAERISKAYGVRPLLADVSLGIQDGDRVGVVGRNGDGKTTLLRLVAGLERPDSGRVTHTRGLRWALVGQHDVLDESASIGTIVVGDRAEHEWASEPTAREIVEHLLVGLSLDRSVAGLSGGERRRVSLARALLEDVELLLLDEPTNHLDIEAVDWLARHLASRSSGRAGGTGFGLVVVTHDRWFLDAVCTTTWEVHDATVDRYDGGYAAYVLAKAERSRQARASESRRQNLVRKELAWLRRGAPARTSKPKFRLDAASVLIEGEPAPRDRVQLERFAAARLGKEVLDLEDATITRGGRDLVDHITWRLGPGDRVGLIGVNGAGKTSVLSVLAGEVRPEAGRLRVGRTVERAYLTQGLDDLDPTKRVLDSVESIRRVASVEGREVTATAMLERFGFTGDRLTARIGDLSGGERRRLQLLRLLLGEPNVLLLDEPTNDLDIETLNVVEDFLDTWPGTLVVISHDRYFLERVTDVVYALLGDGSLGLLPGGVEEYLQRRAYRAAERRTTTSVPAEQQVSPTEGAGERPTVDAAARRAATKELARVERQLEKLHARIEAVHAAMAEHSSDYERLATLDAELKVLESKRESLEVAWLEAADQT